MLYVLVACYTPHLLYFTWLKLITCIISYVMSIFPFRHNLEILSGLLVAKSLGLGHSTCPINLYLLKGWTTLSFCSICCPCVMCLLDHCSSSLASCAHWESAYWWALWVRTSPKRDLWHLNSESTLRRAPDFPLLELQALFLSFFGYYEHEYVVINPYQSLASLNHCKNYS